jgi:hypothetical protein
MTCPRCRQEVEQELYGPCAACRGFLRFLGGPEPDSRFGKPEPLTRVEQASKVTRPVPS